MTVEEWRGDAVMRMTAEGLFDPATDAAWMLTDALGANRGSLFFHKNDVLANDTRARLDAWLKARLTGLPLQYAQNAAWFMGRLFYVDARVLIPRQDTEILCEEALRRMRERPGMRVLDLCTGSGALAVTLALDGNACDVTATDISGDALDVARENARRLGARVRFAQGDLLDAVRGGRFDLIVCNPPYLSADDMARLQKEVAFEPALALAGGGDGLDFYRRLAEEYRSALSDDGALCMEIGSAQAEDVLRLFARAADKGVIKDYAGLDRVVWATVKR